MTLPPCMAPDGGECCQEYHALLTSYRTLLANHDRLRDALNRIVASGDDRSSFTAHVALKQPQPKSIKDQIELAAARVTVSSVVVPDPTAIYGNKK